MGKPTTTCPWCHGRVAAGYEVHVTTCPAVPAQLRQPRTKNDMLAALGSSLRIEGE